MSRKCTDYQQSSNEARYTHHTRPDQIMVNSLNRHLKDEVAKAFKRSGPIAHMMESACGSSSNGRLQYMADRFAY